ncbi:hypothetical protein HKD37_18G050422 [Glycine soja]
MFFLSFSMGRYRVGCAHYLRTISLHGISAQVPLQRYLSPIKMDQYIRDIGNVEQRDQESLPEASKWLQKMIRRCPHHNITQQRLAHIFYGGVSSHNRTGLDVACEGDMRIMKKGINQVEKDNPLTELGKQMQALTLKIETLMIAQAQKQEDSEEKECSFPKAADYVLTKKNQTPKKVEVPTDGNLVLMKEGGEKKEILTYPQDF